MKLSHSAHTQEGRRRHAKAKPELIKLTPEEEALIQLYLKLNFFPTPAWATRAIAHLVRAPLKVGQRILCPEAGQGHMVKVLRALGHDVTASDIHDYGVGIEVWDFLEEETIACPWAGPFDWVFMNPPFTGDEAPLAPSIADHFIARALELAPDVLVFGRLGFMTPGKRYPTMRDHLEAIYVFCDRVSIALGRISKKSGATDYCFYHFKREVDELSDPPTIFIPPGSRARFTLITD